MRGPGEFQVWLDPGDQIGLREPISPCDLVGVFLLSTPLPFHNPPLPGGFQKFQQKGELH